MAKRTGYIADCKRMDSRPGERSSQNIQLNRRGFSFSHSLPSLGGPQPQNLHTPGKAGRVHQEGLACPLLPTPTLSRPTILLLSPLWYQIMAATQNISFPFQIQYSLELWNMYHPQGSQPWVQNTPLSHHFLPPLSESPVFTLVGLLHSDLNYPLYPQVQSSQSSFHLLRQPQLELGSETHAYRRSVGGQSK